MISVRECASFAGLPGRDIHRLTEFGAPELPAEASIIFRRFLSNFSQVRLELAQASSLELRLVQSNNSPETTSPNEEVRSEKLETAQRQPVAGRAS